MLTKFVCLANSFKEGGRCLAGIELDANDNPVIVNGRPKWIRPVCNTEHGEVPNHIAEAFQILNVIELDVTGNRPEGYQSENVIFSEGTIRTVAYFANYHLVNLCDNANMILGNKGRAVSQESIRNLNHSLMLINVNQFEVTQKVYEDNPDRPKTRLAFTYRDTRYDFPVTDPAFLHRYKNNLNLLRGVNQLYLTLSLGIKWEDWYYKLVAGIIF